MKYIISCAWLLLCSSTSVNACDVCGASSGNQNLGLLPQMYRHFAGIQYQYSSFSSTHVPLSDNQPVQYSDEYYQNVQVWGRYCIGKNWQLFGFLPFRYNRSTYTGQTNPVYGVGDATVLVNYAFIQTSDSSGAFLRHRLQGGMGIKAPTGRHKGISQLEMEGLPNMQPGTGAWDFPVNINYTLRYKEIGLNADASYYFTTVNKDNYKYGNKLNTQLTAFYWLQVNKMSILPQIGARYEYALHDYDNYQRKWLNGQTGGTIISGIIGVQLYYGIVGIQLQYSKPVAFSYGGGNITPRQRLDAGLLFLF